MKLKLSAILRSTTLILLSVCGCIFTSSAAAQSATSTTTASPQQPDGQHDFDFEFGTWKTQLRRLVRPLTGSTTWAEYEGTTVVRPVLGGRANLVELVANGPGGRIEGLSMRLYNPATRQWSLNFASPTAGVFTTPVFGEFKNGRGEFYGTDTANGRTVLVRFVIMSVTPRSWRFEQAYSEDAGKTWEINWIVTDTKIDG